MADYVVVFTFHIGGADDLTITDFEVSPELSGGNYIPPGHVLVLGAEATALLATDIELNPSATH